MLLIGPTEAAQAIGAKCGGSAPSAADPALIAILNMMTPRVESALNVYSLTRMTVNERVEFGTAGRNCHWHGGNPPPTLNLRLSNGFLVAGTLVLRDPDGVEIDLTTIGDVDLELGTVSLTSWCKGSHTLTYESGFTPGDVLDPNYPDPENSESRVLQGIPAWMQALAVEYLTLWYRTSVTSPKATKDLSYASVGNALQREITARVYGKYQRPRMGMLFTNKR